MNRNNDVYSVLVTKGNAALATSGTAPDALAVGQLGFFNPDTHLAFGATAPADTKAFYIALGIDPNGVGSLQDIRTSAGQFVQVKGVTGLSYQPHTAGRPMIVSVGNFTPDCDTEYGIRVEFRNSRISRIQGFNQFSKAFIVKTPCCVADATTTDASELSKLFVNAINADESGLVIAKYIARQAVTTATHLTSTNYAQGAVMTEADVNALIAFNKTAGTPKVYADFSLTSVPVAIGSFCQVNLAYHKLLETVLVVSLIEGFNCSGAVTVNQYPAFEEGSGTNVLQKEYHASGWAGSGPYKLSEVTGTAKGDIVYLADKAIKYDQFILQNAFTSESGWLNYESVLSTVIAIPGPDTVTRNAVATMFNSLLANFGFETLVDDAAAANVNPAVVEVDVADPLLDGLA
jgi:hypothetical protein